DLPGDLVAQLLQFNPQLPAPSAVAVRGLLRITRGLGSLAPQRPPIEETRVSQVVLPMSMLRGVRGWRPKRRGKSPALGQIHRYRRTNRPMVIAGYAPLGNIGC